MKTTHPKEGQVKPNRVSEIITTRTFRSTKKVSLGQVEKGVITVKSNTRIAKTGGYSPSNSVFQQANRNYEVNEATRKGTLDGKELNGDTRYEPSQIGKEKREKARICSQDVV